jgi:hypothetical protein
LDSLSVIAALVHGEKRLILDVKDQQGTVIGKITPVTLSTLGEPLVIDAITRWRNMRRKHFFTQFEATPERTRHWLETVVLTDPARLILIVHSLRQPIGHLGFKIRSAELVELDNMLRGEKPEHPELMFRANATMVQWLFSTFDFKGAYMFTLNTNTRALDLHYGIGFKLKESSPVKKIEEDGEARYLALPRDAESPDGLYFYKLELQRGDFVMHKP